MDFRECEYMVEIAKENNITKAAKNLFISQSALNQQLLKLEKELGTQLFVRSRTDWHPTEAGEAYLQGARKALLIKQDTYKRIYSITHSGKSELKIGLTTNRGIRMFTQIYPALHEKYDELRISPQEMSVTNLQQELKAGNIDLGFVTLREDQRTSDDYLTIGSEEMCVLVPRKHPLCDRYSFSGPELPVINLRDLQYEPFVVLSHASTTHQITDDIFRNAGFEPTILMETNSTASLPTLVEADLCCAIVPRYYADENNPRIGCFVLPNHPTWDLCITYRKGAYLTDAAKDFIAMVKDYWAEHLAPVQNN